jgi:NAD(P)-dependent dehydrogenase (short-subunit alcohol dehydrogenase family)
VTASLPWTTAWITGASTGIGREVALQMAAAGVRVAASSRSAASLEGLHPNIRPYPLDVTDAAAVAETVARIEAELGAIDLAVFAAAVYAPVDPARLDLKLFEDALQTNVMGVVNCIAAALPKMQARGKGHLAWFASVAGYRGLPKAAAYGPSKAALINLAESLKPDLSRMGVAVSVINPGFVETPLTSKNDFPMPFLMKPADAARLTIQGLARGRFEISYPWQFVTMLKIARLLPYGLYFRMIDRMVLK